MLRKLVELIQFIFSETKRALTGGLFLLNGLVNCVEDRISNFADTIMQIIIATLQDYSLSDDLGKRLACGMVSDMSNMLQ